MKPIETVPYSFAEQKLGRDHAPNQNLDLLPGFSGISPKRNHYVVEEHVGSFWARKTKAIVRSLHSLRSQAEEEREMRMKQNNSPIPTPYTIRHIEKGERYARLERTDLHDDMYRVQYDEETKVNFVEEIHGETDMDGLPHLDDLYLIPGGNPRSRPNRKKQRKLRETGEIRLVSEN